MRAMLLLAAMIYRGGILRFAAFAFVAFMLLAFYSMTR